MSARHENPKSMRLPIAVRMLGTDDRAEVLRLAGVDSSAVPNPADLLGAEVDGRLIATISLGDGSTIADPFVATSAAVELLRLRSDQLGGARHGSGSGGRLRRVVDGLSRGHAHAALAGSPPGAGGRLLRL